MARRKPSLKQVAPPATFEVNDGAKNVWRISIRDATDNFTAPVHFEAKDAGQRFSMEEIASFAHTECQSGEGLVSVQYINNTGLATMHGRYAIKPMFGQMQVRPLR